MARGREKSGSYWWKGKDGKYNFHSAGKKRKSPERQKPIAQRPSPTTGSVMTKPVATSTTGVSPSGQPTQATHVSGAAPVGTRSGEGSARMWTPRMAEKARELSKERKGEKKHNLPDNERRNTRAYSEALRRKGMRKKGAVRSPSKGRRKRRGVGLSTVASGGTAQVGNTGATGRTRSR